jgi:transposase-like protein
MDTERPPESLQEAILYFADPDRCLAFMVELRWPNGVTCPTCGGKEITFLSTRRVWKCKNRHARQQFSIKVGTIFEDSAIPLSKWLPAMWMLVNCKNGVSSYEVARALRVTQKTAWFMLHRVRLAMQTSTFQKLGGGIVEVDETWIGGKARNMNRGRAAKTKTGHKMGPYARSGKAIVLGMLERGGRVALRVVKNVKRSTLIPLVREFVEEGTEIHSDSLPSYLALEERSYETLGRARYKHKVVDHAVEYVSGNVHVNGIENFWSLLKRAIRGTYVSVEPFHLFRYLDEQAFRFNLRKNNDGGRFREALRDIIGKRLTYSHLTGQDAATATT